MLVLICKNMHVCCHGPSTGELVGIPRLELSAYPSRRYSLNPWRLPFDRFRRATHELLALQVYGHADRLEFSNRRSELHMG